MKSNTIFILVLLAIGYLMYSMSTQITQPVTPPISAGITVEPYDVNHLATDPSYHNNTSPFNPSQSVSGYPVHHGIINSPVTNNNQHNSGTGLSDPNQVGFNPTSTPVGSSPPSFGLPPGNTPPSSDTSGNTPGSSLVNQPPTAVSPLTPSPTIPQIVPTTAPRPTPTLLPNPATTTPIANPNTPIPTTNPNTPIPTTNPNTPIPTSPLNSNSVGSGYGSAANGTGATSPSGDNPVSDQGGATSPSGDNPASNQGSGTSPSGDTPIPDPADETSGDPNQTADIQYADNTVDDLPSEWYPLPPTMEEAKECGVVQIRPTRGQSKGGFFPATKNCNLGERIVLRNHHPGVRQAVSCRVTPYRSFTCSPEQLKQGCNLPPYYMSGTYKCYSAMPGNIGGDAFTNDIVVNNNSDDVYDDGGALMAGI